MGNFVSIFTENEEDTLNNQADQDSSTILNECKRDASKRRPSLAQKMTSNLRRLSGAAELKIDINDSITSNNSKYCNKKIKVSNHALALLTLSSPRYTQSSIYQWYLVNWNLLLEMNVFIKENVPQQSNAKQMRTRNAPILHNPSDWCHIARV